MTTARRTTSLYTVSGLRRLVVLTTLLLVLAASAAQAMPARDASAPQLTPRTDAPRPADPGDGAPWAWIAVAGGVLALVAVQSRAGTRLRVRGV